MRILEMKVPAREENTLLLRMAVAGVGALYDVEVDVMDDLRTAVEESCDLLLHQDYSVQCLTLICDEEKDCLHLSISASKGCPQQTENTADADMAKMIIGTLVRQVELDQDENGVHTVRMILPAKV